MAVSSALRPSDQTETRLDGVSLSDLTRIVLGAPMTLVEVAELLGAEDLVPARVEVGEGTLWVGSVGYEQFKDSREFARLLQGAGVEQVIDVRELPISRRRGYAKTALSQTMADVGIRYVHMRALGNPKPYRDLYKAGHRRQGREKYRRHLLENQRAALDELIELLRERRSALMCLEHDPIACHRTVIVEALRSEFQLEFELQHVGAGASM